VPFLFLVTVPVSEGDKKDKSFMVNSSGVDSNRFLDPDVSLQFDFIDPVLKEDSVLKGTL